MIQTVSWLMLHLGTLAACFLLSSAHRDEPLRDIVLITGQQAKKVPESVARAVADNPAQGLHPLPQGYWLIQRANAPKVLVGPDETSWAMLALLPQTLASIKQLPDDPRSSLGRYSPETAQFIKTGLGRLLPLHDLGSDRAFADRPAMRMPSVSVVVEAEGRRFTLEFTDGPLDKMTQNERAEFRQPLRESPIPFKGSPEAFARAIRAEADSPFLGGSGIQFHILERALPGHHRDDELYRAAMASYLAEKERLRAAAAVAAEGLQALLAERYPDLGRYPVGPLNAKTRDLLAVRLKSQQQAGLPAPNDVDAFLSSARIVSSSVGMSLGVSAQPDPRITWSVRLWPR